MIIDLVRTVDMGRRYVTSLKQELAMLRQDFEASHKDLIDTIEISGRSVAEAEEQLREATLKAYVETGDKAPCPGVAIRIMHRLEYEPRTALAWATEHKIALSLDKTLFEKIAHSQPLAFVAINDIPQATIATDLAKVLGMEADERSNNDRS